MSKIVDLAIKPEPKARAFLRTHFKCGQIARLMQTGALDFTLLPGLCCVGPGLGMPITIMNALIGEPFYQLAGVRRAPIRYSLLANLWVYVWSWFALVPLGCLASGHGDNAVLYFLFAILFTPILLHVKFFFLLKHTEMTDGGLKGVIAGNICSIAVGLAIYFSLPPLRSARPDWVRGLEPWVFTLYISSIIPSLIVFVFAVFNPRRKNSELPGAGALL